MASFELAIVTSPSVFDEIVALLMNEGFDGFWEDGASLRCYSARSSMTPADVAPLRTLILTLAQYHGLPQPIFTTTVIEEQNWDAAWKSTITPFRVTDRIVVAPTWHPYAAQPGDIVLSIDPKMSFGTGYHETTRLMLRLLEKHLRPGATVLDVGTGTGILAIAAVKLGAARATGVDNDEWSFDNAMENIRLNGVADRISIVQGTMEALGRDSYTLIAVNIQRAIIEELLPVMLHRLEPAGTLLLSGLLHDDREPIVAALVSAGLAVVDEDAEQEWIALAVRRT
jgi:ribosomal protein L11 methyltransferase